MNKRSLQNSKSNAGKRRGGISGGVSFDDFIKQNNLKDSDKQQIS